MPNRNKDNSAPRATVSMRDKSRAKMAHVLPCIAKMSDEELATMGLNPAAVEAVMTSTAGVPTMHGASDGVSLSGMAVVAKRAIDRFYDLLAPIDAFSTTYAEDYVIQGQPGILPKLVVPVYDDEDGAEVDNYGSFADRTDSGTVSCAEIELHKVDKVIRIYGRDIQQGVDIEKRLEAAASAMARRVQKFVFSSMAVGTAQADDPSVKVAAITIPAIGNEEGKFNFGYANQVLSENIQPRVNGMLLDSAHYGAIKAANQDSLTAADLDVDVVAKVQDADALGTGAVGLIANRRGAAVGLAAPYMVKGAYASYEQLTRGGQNVPFAVCTWYDPNLNCICIWLGTMVGVKVTDATAIKPLVAA